MSAAKIVAFALWRPAARLVEADCGWPVQTSRIDLQPRWSHGQRVGGSLARAVAADADPANAGGVHRPGPARR